VAYLEGSLPRDKDYTASEYHANLLVLAIRTFWAKKNYFPEVWAEYRGMGTGNAVLWEVRSDIDLAKAPR
jgi:hypothetical protein